MWFQDDTEALSEGQDMGSGEKPPGWLESNCWIKEIF